MIRTYVAVITQVFCHMLQRSYVVYTIIEQNMMTSVYIVIPCAATAIQSTL